MVTREPTPGSKLPLLLKLIVRPAFIALRRQDQPAIQNQIEQLPRGFALSLEQRSPVSQLGALRSLSTVLHQRWHRPLILLLLDKAGPACFSLANRYAQAATAAGCDLDESTNLLIESGDLSLDSLDTMALRQRAEQLPD